MPDNNDNEEESPLHYESGIPVFGPSPQDENTQRRTERKAQHAYEERQISIQSGMLLTQIALVVFGIIGGGISIYQAYTAHVSADASIISAQAAQSAADTAREGLQETRNESRSSNDQFKSQLGRLDASIKAAQEQATATHEFAIQAQRSADYAKQSIDTSVASERPWVGVTTFYVESHAEGQTAKAHFILGNTGKRPASTTVRVTRRTFNSLPPSPFAGDNNPTSVAFLLPGATASTIYNYEFPLGFIQSSKRSHSNEFFIAEIIYTDVETGVAYITHYCSFFDPSNTDVPFPLCTRYNDAK